MAITIHFHQRTPSIIRTPDCVTLISAIPGRAIPLSIQTAATLRGHRDFAFAAAFSPCGALVATGGQDRSARVWDMRRTDRALYVLPAARGAVRALVFSRGGRWLAAGTL